MNVNERESNAALLPFGKCVNPHGGPDVRHAGLDLQISELNQ
jgi:hypothetical protein